MLSLPSSFGKRGRALAVLSQPKETLAVLLLLWCPEDLASWWGQALLFPCQALAREQSFWIVQRQYILKECSVFSSFV